jgi:hypothetical protein
VADAFVSDPRKTVAEPSVSMADAFVPETPTANAMAIESRALRINVIAMAFGPASLVYSAATISERCSPFQKLRSKEHGGAGHSLSGTTLFFGVSFDTAHG